MRVKLRVVRAGLHRATARFRHTPDFLVVGAQKAGTTSLLRYLEAHPDVRTPSVPGADDLAAKELHFFDRDEAELDLADYRANFPLSLGRAGAVTVGEATPVYLFDPRVPGRVAELLPAPGPKLIVLLRDPAERAWSQFQMSRAHGLETLEFVDALAAENERLAPWRADPFRSFPPPEDHWRWASYATRGRYAEQLTRWSQRFAPERILVLRTEDLAERADEVYGEVLDFLGLTRRPLADPTVHNRGAERGAVPAPARKHLAEALADDQARLPEVLAELGVHRDRDEDLPGRLPAE